MLLLFYSDLHLKEQGSFSPWNSIDINGYTKELNNRMKSLDFLLNIIKKYNPDYIFNLGDVFNSPDLQTTQTLSAASKFFTALSETKKPHYILLGNHDIHNEIHYIFTISILNKYCQILDTTQVLDLNGFKIGCIPYLSNIDTLYRDIILMSNNCDLLITHCEFQGAKYENKKIIETGIDSKLNIPCISGHLHLAHSINSVHYVGSMVQDKFLQKDLDSIGGIILFDTETKEIKRIQNFNSKHFIKINEEDFTLLPSLNSDNCVLQIHTSLKKTEIDDFMQKHYPKFEYVHIKETKKILVRNKRE